MIFLFASIFLVSWFVIIWLCTFSTRSLLSLSHCTTTSVTAAGPHSGGHRGFTLRHHASRGRDQHPPQKNTNSRQNTSRFTFPCIARGRHLMLHQHLQQACHGRMKSAADWTRKNTQLQARVPRLSGAMWIHQIGAADHGQHVQTEHPDTPQVTHLLRSR